MWQLDAMTLSHAIRSRLVDFALDNNYVLDERLRVICREIWAGVPEHGGLVSDLWVEGAFPARPVDETLASLVTKGLFHGDLCHHLDRRKAVPRDRPLYEHQHEAILRAQADRGASKPALVVTAGTGAGKTESFLLPILNDLFANSRTHGQGAQCLILYPMNALVNDQVDRLYNWLQGQDRLTLFHFTGETPEDAKAADELGIKPWEPCRMRTRREARGLETREGKARPEGSARGPQPDILITNYSMLEYMLCRPQDTVFFGKSLRAIVLDEAHLYTGTLAAEITLLLRRLLERCGVAPEQILHLATSATIGTGEPGELEEFAATIFTKTKDLVEVIRGTQMRVALPPPRPPAQEPTAEAIAAQELVDQPHDPERCSGQPIARRKPRSLSCTGNHAPFAY